MDILHLVDRLEELFNESRPIWFTHSVVVDEDRMLDLIDQMRVSIPEEIKKAQQMLAQRDRLLAQAQEEANRTIQLAREKAAEIIERESVIQQAQIESDAIIARAHEEAELTRQEADVYVRDSLANLKHELERLLVQVHNGIRTLESQEIQQQQQQQPANQP